MSDNIGISSQMNLTTNGDFVRVCPCSIFKHDLKLALSEVVKDVVFHPVDEISALFGWITHSCEDCDGSQEYKPLVRVAYNLYSGLRDIEGFNKGLLMSVASSLLTGYFNGIGAGALSFALSTLIHLYTGGSAYVNKIRGSLKAVQDCTPMYKAFILRQILRVLMFSTLCMVSWKLMKKTCDFVFADSSEDTNSRVGLIAACLMAFLGVKTMGHSFNAVLGIVNAADLRSEFKRGFDSFVNALLKVIEKCLSFFNEGYMARVAQFRDDWVASRSGVSEQEFEQKTKLATSLLTSKNATLGYLGSNLLKDNLKKAISELENFSLVSKSVAQKQQLSKMMTGLSILEAENSWLCSMSKCRFAPRMVYLFGAPGIGKSYCADSIMGAIWTTFARRAHLPEHLRQDVESIYYTRNSDSEFFDGYSSQPIIYYSDLFRNSFAADRVAQEAHFRELSEIQHLVDTAPYFPPFAFEATPRRYGKGVAIAPHFVFATGNYFDVTMFGDRSVIQRRVHHCFLAISTGRTQNSSFDNLAFYRKRTPLSGGGVSWSGLYNVEHQVPKNRSQFENWPYKDDYEPISKQQMISIIVDSALDEMRRFENVQSSSNPFLQPISLSELVPPLPEDALEDYWKGRGFALNKPMTVDGLNVTCKDEFRTIETRRGNKRKVYTYISEEQKYCCRVRGGAAKKIPCTSRKRSKFENDCLFEAIAHYLNVDASPMRAKCRDAWKKQGLAGDPFAPGLMIEDSDIPFAANIFRVNVRLWVDGDGERISYWLPGRKQEYKDIDVFHSFDHYQPMTDVEFVDNPDEIVRKAVDVRREIFYSKGFVMGPIDMHKFCVHWGTTTRLLTAAVHNGLATQEDVIVVQASGDTEQSILNSILVKKGSRSKDPTVFLIHNDKIWIRYSQRISIGFDVGHLSFCDCIVDKMTHIIHGSPQMAEQDSLEIRVRSLESITKAAHILRMPLSDFLSAMYPCVALNPDGQRVLIRNEMWNFPLFDEHEMVNSTLYSLFDYKMYGEGPPKEVPLVHEVAWKAVRFLRVLRENIGYFTSLLIVSCGAVGLVGLVFKAFRRKNKDKFPSKTKETKNLFVASDSTSDLSALKVYLEESGVKVKEEENALLTTGLTDVDWSDVVRIPLDELSSLNVQLRASCFRPCNFPRVSLMDGDREVSHVTGLNIGKGLVIFPKHLFLGAKKPMYLKVMQEKIELSDIVDNPTRRRTHDVALVVLRNFLCEGVPPVVFKPQYFKNVSAKENAKVLALTYTDGKLNGQMAYVESLCLSTHRVKHSDSISKDLEGYLVSGLKLMKGDCGALLIHRGQILGFLSAVSGDSSLWTALTAMQISNMLRDYADENRPFSDAQSHVKMSYGGQPEHVGMGLEVSSFKHFLQRPFDEQVYQPERTEIARDLDPTLDFLPASMNYQAWLNVKAKFPEKVPDKMPPELDVALDVYFERWNESMDELPNWTCAVNGCCDTACTCPVLKKVVLETSPGKPFTEPPNASKGKPWMHLCGVSDKTKMYTTQDGLLKCDEQVLKMAEYILSDWKRGKVPRVPFTCNLKRELRDSERVHLNKTRLFVAPPHHLNLALRKLLGEWAGRMKRQGRRLCHAIGVNVHSGEEWSNIRTYLSPNGWKVIGPDFSAYDTSHSVELNQKVADYIARFYPQHLHKAIRAALLSICCFENKDKVFELSKTGLSSGSQITTQVNCVYTFIIYYAACLSWFNGNRAKVDKNFRIICYGDDAVLSVSPEILGNDNGESFIKHIIAYANKCGYKVTNGDKGDLQAFVGIGKVRFLKRLFRFDDSANTVCCPLPLQQIYKPILYYADEVVDKEENRQSSMRALALEVAELPEAERFEVWDRFVKVVNQNAVWKQSFERAAIQEFCDEVYIMKTTKKKTGWSGAYLQAILGSGSELSLDYSDSSAWCSSRQ